MKKLSLVLLSILSISLTGCDDFKEQIGIMMGDRPTLYEFKEMSGRWNLISNQNPVSKVKNAYFIFDGTKKVMNAKYYEDDKLVFDTKFHGVYNGKDDGAPLSLVFKGGSESFVDDKTLWCYTEDEQANLKQFTICYEDINVGTVRGMIDYHPYQLDTLPFAIGTYLKEGNTYKEYEASIIAPKEIRNGYFYNEESRSYFYQLCNTRNNMNDYRSLFIYDSISLSSPIFASLYISYNETNKQYYARIYQEHSMFEPYEKEAGASWPCALILKNFEVDLENYSFSFKEVEEVEDGNTLNLDPKSIIPGTYKIVDDTPTI